MKPIVCTTVSALAMVTNLASGCADDIGAEIGDVSNFDAHMHYK